MSIEDVRIPNFLVGIVLEFQDFICQQPLEFQTFLSNLFWNSIFFMEKNILYRGSDIIWNSPLLGAETLVRHADISEKHVIR